VLPHPTTAGVRLVDVVAGMPATGEGAEEEDDAALCRGPRGRREIGAVLLERGLPQWLKHEQLAAVPADPTPAAPADATATVLDYDEELTRC
jgi:hypothetical protein